MVGVANFLTDQDVYFQAEVRHNEGQKENGSKGGHFFRSTYFKHICTCRRRNAISPLPMDFQFCWMYELCAYDRTVPESDWRKF